MQVEFDAQTPIPVDYLNPKTGKPTRNLLTQEELRYVSAEAY